MLEDAIREVRAKSLRETFYQFDPELAARDVYPKEMRRDLTTVRPWIRRAKP